MLRLNNSVRLVIFQFSFKNAKYVPGSVRMVMPETYDEARARKERAAGGELVIPLTDNVSLLEFPNDLEESDYELVGASHQPRDYKDIVWFTFAQKEKAAPRKEFLVRRNAVFDDLTEIFRTVIWRTRGFLNPYFLEGEPTDEHVFQVCLGARKPLLRSDGTPVTVWQKDKNGERVGKAPLPLTPDCRLRVINGVVDLLSWDA